MKSRPAQSPAPVPLQKKDRTHLPCEGLPAHLWHDACLLDRLWQTERRRSLFGRQSPERSGPGWWSMRSRSYTRRSGGARGRRRQEKLMLLLEQAGFLGRQHEALDIGCGSGNVALPLARRMKRVIALDPSEEMLALLRRRAAKAGIKNIETMLMRWEDVDLDTRGWRGRFRVAIASMSPGIHDAASLRKMHDASHCGCYFNSFTRRADRAQEDLWRIFFGEPLPAMPADAFYVFHLLHAWGFCPSLELSSEATRRRYSPAKAVEELGLLMIPYVEQTKRSQAIIEDYVRAASPQGTFVRHRSFVEARILWSVKQQPTAQGAWANAL